MTKNIRLGIVGTGGMADQHAEQFAKIPSVTPTACLDTVPERAKTFAQTVVAHIGALGRLGQRRPAVAAQHGGGFGGASWAASAVTSWT